MILQDLNHLPVSPSRLQQDKSFTISFFFNDTATTEIYTPLYTLSLHDALPISRRLRGLVLRDHQGHRGHPRPRSEEHTSELQSHSGISYAVFCLKKKKQIK